MGVTVKPKERKPPWLHRLCTDGAGAMLHDVLCEGCGDATYANAVTVYGRHGIPASYPATTCPWRSCCAAR